MRTKLSPTARLRVAIARHRELIALYASLGDRVREIEQRIELMSAIRLLHSVTT